MRRKIWFCWVMERVSLAEVVFVDTAEFGNVQYV
jgi:hypothetical protein